MSNAFEPVEVPRVSAQPPATRAPESEAPTAEVTPASGAEAESTPTQGSSDEEWKSEYDSQVEEWKARSAEQREKAEESRARWEKIRAEEQKESSVWRGGQVGGGSAASTSGWVHAEASGVQGRTSPSPVDVRDLVSGEAARGGKHQVSTIVPSSGGLISLNVHNSLLYIQPEPSSTLSSPPVTVSNEAVQVDSDPEYISSELTSSYPSINFPSDVNSPSSNPQRPLHPRQEMGLPPHLQRQQEPPKPSATSAVFDTTLSKRTRVMALVSSLAINLLLPFINGVMLGFGELFAKNVVLGWFGWKNPGNTAANVGIRRRDNSRRKEL